MKLPAISLDKQALSSFDDAVQKEWVITNGLGGYASSTVLGINTRKYHGLLVAAFHPPGDRRVCLAKLDEELGVGNCVYPIYANEFQNGVFPQGYRFLKQFSISPFPKYCYDVENVELRKTVFMLNGKNLVITVYRILNRNDYSIKLRVFPLINWRHFHSVTDRLRKPLEFAQRHDDREVSISSGAPSYLLVMKSTDGHFRLNEKWIERLYYREEADRGEDCLDDCYQPGYFEKEVKADRSEVFAVIALAGEDEESMRKTAEEMPFTIRNVEELYEQEMKQRKDFVTQFYEAHKGMSETDWLNWLLLASDSFVVRGLVEEQRSVIAGYHWFESWGRDTFVSLPGLMLVTGRFEDARRVFLSFKKYCKDGLIPNFIPDRGEPFAYNTVDATLWFVNAILQYLKHTGDFGFVREQLWETLKAIIEAHVKGTAFNIRMDGDGLLSHGSQLTWMDAAVDGQPVTPRTGKAVEVQALWYNALKTGELLAGKFGEENEVERFRQIAEKAEKGFVEKFWNVEKDCLFDVVGECETDGSLRPNQVIAVALDFSMLDVVKSGKVVDVVCREFLTPFGLRTLARNDPRYVGVYAGDRGSRDRAYHNGSVWPWLLGSFVTAFLKTNGYTESSCRQAWSFLVPLLTKHVYDAGLGSVSEIFDGEPPHKPRGCVSQAWSVAEPLRTYVEDVLQVRPKHEKEVLQRLG